MTNPHIDRIKRILRKPPHIIGARVYQELLAHAQRYWAPHYARNFKAAGLLKATQQASLSSLWQHLSQAQYPTLIDREEASAFNYLYPHLVNTILTQAEKALQHTINLLGTGPINLGDKIDWHKDYKVNIRWAPQYFRDIEYNNLDKPSDVKIPWEISRLQWLIPAGQAYLLTQDEKYAEAVKKILSDWIVENPYAQSINWACTMEVAMRIFVWTWFFHVFKNSVSWQDDSFRSQFLCALYLHGEFTEKYIERSDINGNHFTADAAALVFIGHFFNSGKMSLHWQQLGWKFLCDEISKQTSSDGVNFEASVPYHRLVQELFLFSALYRKNLGLEIPELYQQYLIKMADFTAHYSRQNGSVPLLGDADDARTLPFGQQDFNDHRYLIGLVALTFNNTELLNYFNGNHDEIFWILGSKVIDKLNLKNYRLPASSAFSDGGIYIMRHEQDHIFIDCAPIGTAGRGGHGHNDCLSFEASLLGENLISDSGAYIYTGSYKDRNLFRSTAYHNTPCINHEEINRFIRPDYLWTLHYDAIPELLLWKTNEEKTIWKGSHRGYERLTPPLKPIRTILFNHNQHAVIIRDEFKGNGEYQFTIPLHLALNVKIKDQNSNSVILQTPTHDFILYWLESDAWEFNIEIGEISPSYGIKYLTSRLRWQRHGTADIPLTMCLMPLNTVPKDIEDWIEGELKLSS